MNIVSTDKYGTVVTWDETGMFKITSGFCAGLPDTDNDPTDPNEATQHNPLTITRTSGYYSGYPFEPNAKIFEEYTVTDVCGNKSSCSFYVTTTQVVSRSASLTVSSDNNSVINGLYPNPAKSEIIVAINGTENSDSELRAFNTFGQVVLTQKVTLNTGSNEIKLDISNLSSGIYLISVSGNGQSPMRFVKE